MDRPNRGADPSLKQQHDVVAPQQDEFVDVQFVDFDLPEAPQPPAEGETLEADSTPDRMEAPEPESPRRFGETLEFGEPRTIDMMPPAAFHEAEPAEVQLDTGLDDPGPEPAEMPPISEMDQAVPEAPQATPEQRVHERAAQRRRERHARMGILEQPVPHQADPPEIEGGEQDGLTRLAETLDNVLAAMERVAEVAESLQASVDTIQATVEELPDRLAESIETRYE
jgi:hypothetical protein